MNQAKRLLAEFSSCLLVAACAVAFAAAPAQAEGNWLVNGKSFVSLNPSLSWLPDQGLYTFLVPNLNLELVFHGFIVYESTLTSEGHGTAKFEFTEGEVNTISPLKPIACEVGNLLFKVKSNLFLHEGKTYNVLTPAEGKTLTVTKYGGKSCVLTEKNNVTGAMVLEDPEGLEKEAIKHLVRQAPAGLFPELEMLFGASKMSLDANWWQQLAGAHEGLKWSGVG